MAKLFRIFICFLILIFFDSCSSKKNVLYFQDFDNVKIEPISYEEYKLRADDILKIEVTTGDVESTTIYSQSSLAQQNTKESMLYSGYQIDLNGFINFPMLGKLRVSGLTINQLKELIFNSVVESDILVNPFIDVKLLNSYFTVLGEVNMPGRYDFLKNNMNILEAIGVAGDLTINGKRKDIKLIRKDFLNETSVYSIDLTSLESVTKNYQIFSGDIIVVGQNSNRVKNAGIIGNSGTLLSLLSFILSSIIVINN